MSKFHIQKYNKSEYLIAKNLPHVKKSLPIPADPPPKHFLVPFTPFPDSMIDYSHRNTNSSYKGQGHEGVKRGHNEELEDVNSGFNLMKIEEFSRNTEINGKFNFENNEKSKENKKHNLNSQSYGQSEINTNFNFENKEKYKENELKYSEKHNLNSQSYGQNDELGDRYSYDKQNLIHQIETLENQLKEYRERYLLIQKDLKKAQEASLNRQEEEKWRSQGGFNQERELWQEERRDLHEKIHVKLKKKKQIND